MYWKDGPGRCRCGAEREFVNRPLIDAGRIVAELPSATEIRAYVLEQLDGLTLEA